jgi:hypothetical protein
VLVTTTQIAPLYRVREFGLINTAFSTIANGSWSSPAIWDEGVVPGGQDDAEIRNSDTLTSAEAAASLKISAGATLTINPGAALTVGSSSDALYLSKIENFGTITINSSGSVKTYSTVLNQLGGLIDINTGGMFILFGMLNNFGNVTNDGTVDIGQ